MGPFYRRLLLERDYEKRLGWTDSGYNTAQRPPDAERRLMALSRAIRRWSK